LAANQAGTGSIASAGSKVYWCAQGEIRYCSLPDCSGGVKIFAGNQTNCHDVAVDSSDGAVFWTISTPYNSTSGGAVRWASGSGVPVTPIGGTDLPFPHAITISGSDVFWLDYGTFTSDNYNYDAAVIRYSRSTGTAIVLSKGSWLNQPEYLSANSSRVYFCDLAAGIRTTPLPNGSGSSVAQIIAATALQEPPILADDNALYFFDGPNVDRCPPAGCSGSPFIIAVGDQPGYMLAQDAAAVYWTTWNGVQGKGSVMKVAK
jgi:hypothetical protein